MSFRSGDGEPFSLPVGLSFPAESPRVERHTAGDSEEPPSARFQGEDFLFHLYRGSELLQDNCVEEAKEELERALKMQPLDVEGQGLLGVVYFRLGLYPRAIEIYRDIITACPDEVTPKLNLSLCYLKTGQPGEARDLLETVIRRVPDHRRAWGYLGLSFERLGEYDKALHAFEQAGQPALVRRMQQIVNELNQAPSEPAPPREELRRAAADAVEELDAATEGAVFERATSDGEAGGLRGGRWRAHEPGEEPMPPLARSRRPSLASRLSTTVPSILPGDPAHPEALGVHRVDSPRPMQALTPEALVSARRVEAPSHGAELGAQGLVFVQVTESFAVRGDRVRALRAEGASFSPTSLKRRSRGREIEEAFGGAGANWVRLDGRGLLVLEPSSDQALMLLRLSGEFVYLRETRLVGFGALVRYENGRLPAADPGPVAMVQLAGEGVVVFEASPALSAIAVTAERPLTVRAAAVLGWTGRLLGQAVPAEQAPHLGGGFVAFSGDGAVLVDDP